MEDDERHEDYGYTCNGCDFNSEAKDLFVFTYDDVPYCDECSLGIIANCDRCDEVFEIETMSFGLCENCSSDLGG